ncbi:MAG: hypothetical protein WC830_21100 [Burkholderiales bacterium]|jgi:hypothetical protein
MDIKRYTEAEVLEDYRIGMQMVADQLALLVGKQAAASVAGLTIEELDEVNPGFSAGKQILDSEGASLLRQVCQFAFLGKLSGWLAEEIDDESVRRWETMFTGLNNFVSANWGGAPFAKCLHVIRIAKLRVSLMPGTHSYSFSSDGKEFVQGCLHLRELAILSGLEEKTLRNMGSASHKQHLPTIKRGSRTYVALTVALPWLEARGFAPIVYDEPPASRNLRANPFYSNADMANFVKTRGEELGLSDELSQQEVSAEPELLKCLQTLEQGVSVQDPFVWKKLAALLYPSNPPDFLEAVEDIGLMGARFTSL